MRNTIKYEWTLEEIDNGDVVDSYFSDTLTFDKNLLGMNTLLGLVRNEGNENDGVTDRLWAYVKNSKLPEYFSNADGQQVGYKVPVKYHKELAKYFAS